MVSFSNGGSSDEFSNNRPLENGHVPKYKHRKIFATRDFPPGCGPNVVPMDLKPEENGSNGAPILEVGGLQNGLRNSKMTNSVVANGVGTTQMTNLMKAEAVGNSEMTNVMEAAETVKLSGKKTSEKEDAVGTNGIQNANIEVDRLLHDAVHNTVDVDISETLDALVEKVAATVNGVEKLRIEIGALGIQSPNVIESQAHEAVNNPSEIERAESLDAWVGDVMTMPMDGLVGIGTLSDMKSGSSKEVNVAEGRSTSKELNVEGLALVHKSCVEEAKPMQDVGALVNELILMGNSQSLSSFCGGIKPETPIRPNNKCRRRRVSAVRDFPPHCGSNVPLPTEGEKQMVTFGNDGLDMNEKFEMETEASRNCSDRGAPIEMLMTSKKAFPNCYDTDGTCKISFMDKEDCGDYDESLPITTYELDNRDEDSVRDVGKEIVLYSQEKSNNMRPLQGVFTSADEVDRGIVHGLMSASYCTWTKRKVVSSNEDGRMSGENKKKQNLSWRKKAKAVAKKSIPPYVNSSFSGVKSKKQKKVRVSNDADGNSGALVLVDEDGYGHEEDVPLNSSMNSKTRDFDISLPPFGPNNSDSGDARHKVRETLRLFHGICRKLLQQEEANSIPEEEGKSKSAKKPQRIDLLTAKIIKDKGKEVNTSQKILGQVPGVEVGDEFQYRVELAVVGIHGPYQAGIDWIKLNGVPVCTSIVSSGAYADDVENADVLIYSGQGGNIVGKCKVPQDQKLERGNLALRNSISAQTPVRVVRGWKETKLLDPLDSRPKIITTYVYDGLYTVKNYWTETGSHGKLVFMFELRRNPGQPDLAWKELKKSSKNKFRPGVCVHDISDGKEPFPICAVNTIDDEKPPPFTYVSKMKYPDWHRPIPPMGCDCTGRCSGAKKCKCAFRNGGEIPYNHNGALVETKTLVYECGPYCKCPPSCYNRVAQKGIRFQLEIFKTKSRGWGLRPLTSIPSGSFICEYAGELLEDKEAEKKIGSDEYLFDIGHDYNDPSINPEEQGRAIQLVDEGGGYTIDAAVYGNVGRFVNHSCSPNLYAQNVIHDHDDKKMPHVMLFAMENIPPLKELTYHYNYSVDQIRDSDGNIKVKKCYCGSAQCTGRLY